ncbi:hypothetical protein [Rubripirellula amarantea]|uniref:hypothetical protein n=1 Tax=Rubripirellula amarantea TaxID=2527999 RepID=UPI0013EF4DF5|nr:hypothetical protein [Rubripirellula amarantea]
MKAISMLPSNPSTTDALASGSQSSGSSFVVGSVATQAESFVDRRSTEVVKPGSSERRQFGNSHFGLSEDGRELALAIDQYKVKHHRRYLTCDEMIEVIQSLGYSRAT